MYETGRIFHTGGICFGVGTVQSEIEREVREFALDFLEVVDIGSLFECTRTVPERNGTFGLLGLEQVHDMAAHRRHAGTSADEDELLIVGQVVGQEELSVRT